MTVAAIVAQFDDLRGWTADAVEQLGIDHDTGRLSWRVEPGCSAPGSRPAAVPRRPNCWTSVRVPWSCGLGGRTVRGAADSAGTDAADRLPRRRTALRLAVIRRDGAELPLQGRDVRQRWCLGVLCTSSERLAQRHPSVLARCLARAPHGCGPKFGHLPAPDGDHLQPQDELVHSPTPDPISARRADQQAR